MIGVCDSATFWRTTFCSWRMLPKEFPPWQTVYWWFRRFMRRFLFETIHDMAVMIDRERVGREARAVAALNHPNICTLFDVGPNYLVMEYIEGAPVAGPLPPEEALRLAVQIAGALEQAHGHKPLLCRFPISREAHAPHPCIEEQRGRQECLHHQ